jgi:hypothetical protein
MKAKPNTDPNRFYVYGHYNLDGNLFYIGKGCARRAWSKSERSLKWDEVANKGYSVKLLHENLTEDKALELEVELINSEKKVNPFLLNKRSTNNRIELDYETINLLFYYDESSPSCLRRKIDIINSIGKVSRHKDTQVGWYTDKGYCTEIKGQSIQVHRLVYLLHNGEINSRLQIDHINGDPLDNRIDNLREVTASVNTKNRVIRNKTESSFIHFKESTRKGIDCSAYYIKFDLKGKRVTFYFYVKDYESKEQAFVACKEYKESIRDVLLLTGIPERVIDYGT